MFNLIHLLFCTVVNTNYNYAFILTFTNICIILQSSNSTFSFTLWLQNDIFCFVLNVQWFLYFPFHVVLIHNFILLIYVRIQLLPI